MNQEHFHAIFCAIKNAVEDVIMYEDQGGHSIRSKNFVAVSYTNGKYKRIQCRKKGWLVAAEWRNGIDNPPLWHLRGISTEEFSQLKVGDVQ